MLQANTDVVSIQRALCVCVSLLTVFPLAFPQRFWVEVYTSTRTSSCATQTPSIGRTLSRTRGSTLWWFPPIAVSCVSNTTSRRSNDVIWFQPFSTFKVFASGSGSVTKNVWHFLKVVWSLSVTQYKMTKIEVEFVVPLFCCIQFEQVQFHECLNPHFYMTVIY